MNKKYGMIAALSFLALLCSGCALSKDSVKLKNKSEMTKYVKEKYGEAEFIREESVGDGKSFTFRDKDLGIEYTVRSSPSSIGIDGNILGYQESVRSDFPTVYRAYIYDGLDEELEAKAEMFRSRFGDVKLDKDGDSILTVYLLAGEKHEDAEVEWVASSFGSLFTDRDPKDIYQYVTVKDGYEKILGKYDFKTGIYLDTKDIERESAMCYAEEIMHRDGYPGAKKPKKRLVWKETRTERVGDLPGIDSHRIVTDNFDEQCSDDTDDIVTVYYFEFDGDMYFIADHLYVEDEWHYPVGYVHKAQ